MKISRRARRVRGVIQEDRTASAYSASVAAHLPLVRDRRLDERTAVLRELPEVIDRLEEVRVRVGLLRVCEDRVANLAEFPLDLPLHPAALITLPRLRR